MLDSIDYPVENLLIIDNGGQLDSIRVPSCVQSYRVLSMVSNLGVSTSWNLGIKLFYNDGVFSFASADMWFATGDLEKLAQADSKRITLHRHFPHWQAFAVGSEVVEKIGLFDEALHPIYFEDNDYERRAKKAGVSIVYADLMGGHDNSSTIQSDEHYQKRNSATFQENRLYYENKIATEDYSSGQWQLSRTRKNSWAK